LHFSRTIGWRPAETASGGIDCSARRNVARETERERLTGVGIVRGNGQDELRSFQCALIGNVVDFGRRVGDTREGGGVGH
jgi:hypothetical protein